MAEPMDDCLRKKGGFTMKLKIYQDKAGEWRWRLVAANGRKVADSGEGYTRKADVIRAARKFIRGIKLVVDNVVE